MNQHPNGFSISSADVAALLPKSVKYCALQCFLTGRTTPKTVHSCVVSRPHLIRGSLTPPEWITQAASGSVQPFLQGSLTWPTDRHTDRPHYCVCSNRRQTASSALSACDAAWQYLISIRRCMLSWVYVLLSVCPVLPMASC